MKKYFVDNRNDLGKPNSKIKWYSRKIFLADKDNPFILPEEHDAPYCLYNTNYKCEYLKYDGCCDKDCLYKSKRGGTDESKYC